MLYLLSPAKSLDYETPVAPEVQAMATPPQFAACARELIALLRAKTPAEVARLMNLSDALAGLNVARYAAWSGRATARNSKPALLAFDGDVYTALAAPTLSLRDLAWAQRHLLILSGLYGVLRPLDRLQPYRLEMGTRLANSRGKDLYAFWRDTLSHHLNRQRRVGGARVIVNLASQEYGAAIDRKAVESRVVDCVFEDWRQGRYQVIGLFAKRARGLMMRYAIEQRVVAPARLQGFAQEGYAFDAAASQPDRLVFRRKQRS